ncbi:futalosine hydrolase [Mucilaginibacter boryungensis]|uniref:Futalosine hydrolase n=1 Tax=Mucilaginibacter boryungensis TaxID=768480 RepID=A0ABR9XNL7_9SPHI|nr:futalosine hydrolase [Mucilaginibacter boryungensis]MBE9668842.1 futalosine hydrolase [Mucilaginibacter boryungensis]
MKILIVAATQSEIEPLFQVGSLTPEVQSPQSEDLELPTQDLRLLVTGVGMVATAFALGRHLATHQYDLAINLGIAGSFDRSLDLGEVVEVTTDILAELGAEDDEDFLSIEQLGFGESVFTASTTLSGIFNQHHIDSSNLLLKHTTGITVNTVHGNEQAIEKITSRLDVQVESMEGAAFFYACRKAGIPCIQIRAVSNYVEKRNRDGWQIGLAIKNLNTFADALLKRLG